MTLISLLFKNIPSLTKIQKFLIYAFLIYIYIYISALNAFDIEFKKIFSQCKSKYDFFKNFYPIHI